MEWLSIDRWIHFLAGVTWIGLLYYFWPNQKKVLGLVSATDEEKARARRMAFLASRTNTVDPHVAVQGGGQSRPAILIAGEGSG